MLQISNINECFIDFNKVSFVGEIENDGSRSLMYFIFIVDGIAIELVKRYSMVNNAESARNEAIAKLKVIRDNLIHSVKYITINVATKSSQ